MKRLSGTVAWFNEQKGYGEIVSDNLSDAYFFSYREIRRTCAKGSLKSVPKGTVVSFIPSNRNAFGLPVAEEVRESK